MRLPNNKAFVLGITNYETEPTEGCAADAQKIAKLLENNEPHGRNFGVTLGLEPQGGFLTSLEVKSALEALVSEPLDTALFYFAGHGSVDPITNNHSICVSDRPQAEQHIRLSEILHIFNSDKVRIRSKILILDCCFAGAATLLTGFGDQIAINHIPDGTTILAASSSTQISEAKDNSGVFSNLLIDALEGAAADVLGRITPASVYTHIDQALGPNKQRPIYMANVREFVTLRQVSPSVPRELIYKLPIYFPEPDGIFALDPSFEPDRKNIPEKFRHLPVDPVKTAQFKELQTLNRNGLLVPHEAEHMYDAAMNSTGCKLTRTGKHYRYLAELGEV